MRMRPDLSLLVIGLTRSTLFEQRPDWGTAAIHNLRLDLLPLSDDHCCRLVAEILQKVPEPYVEFTTKFGRKKKIPIEHTWHHKSCGHCGHIPGYASSILWLHRQFNLDYHDPTDQTSCTGWNYYASAASNAVGQAAVMSRNFAAAYETGYFPLIHCGTSFGHYKEIREQLVHHKELRDEVRRILDKMGKPLVIPEEIVHYSEWVYAMRQKFAERGQILPRERVERSYADIRRWVDLPRGGHFVAAEAPDVLAEELRTFFRAFRAAS